MLTLSLMLVLMLLLLLLALILSLMLVLLLFFRLRSILISDINVDLFVVIDVDHNFVVGISVFCVLGQSRPTAGKA